MARQALKRDIRLAPEAEKPYLMCVFGTGGCSKVPCDGAQLKRITMQLNLDRVS